MEPFNAGWLSIVPPIVAIVLALVTKEVLSSLVLGILTGQRGKMPPPLEGFMQMIGPREQAAINDFLAMSVVGSEETVRQGFARIQQQCEADELILVSDVYDPALRLRSLEIAAQAVAKP